MYGFEKKDRANISLAELHTFRSVAKKMLAYSEAEFDYAIREGALLRVNAPGGNHDEKA